MKFKPLRDLVLLEVSIPKKTPAGINLPEQSRKIDHLTPMKIVAMGEAETTLKVGDRVLLHGRIFESAKEALFRVPDDPKEYILVSIFEIAGTVS